MVVASLRKVLGLPGNSCFPTFSSSLKFFYPFWAKREDTFANVLKAVGLHTLYIT